MLIERVAGLGHNLDLSAKVGVEAAIVEELLAKLWGVGEHLVAL